MKKCGLFLIILFICNTIFNTVNSTAQEYDLKYKLAKDTKFTLSVSNISKQVRDQMGTEIIINTTGNIETACSVISEEKSGLTLEFEYSKASVKSDGTMGAGSVDYSELLNKKVRFILSPKGNVSGFEGFETLPEINGLGGEIINKDAYMQEVKNLFPKLPENPIKKGEVLTVTQEDDMPVPGGSIKIVTDYAYNLLEETKKNGIDCLKFEVKLSQTTTGEFEQEGMQLALEQQGGGDYILYFAHKKGMLLHFEGTLKSEGVVDVIGMEVQVPITGESKSSLTVVF